jgi:glutamate-ammonia-ligase adenylyltransferase
MDHALTEFPTDTATRAAALARAIAHAPFLAMLAQQRPDLTDIFVAQGPTAALSNCAKLPVSISPTTIMADLRHRRNDLALVLALADLSGAHDFGMTVRALSDFADEACNAALTAAFAERHPGEPVRGLAIIALGKLGSHELNYSSDIDPILIFDPATLPARAREEQVENAVRIARRWVDILAMRTGDGHVQRVDLRLRPSPEATPIVLPVDAAISYYESQALAWEQAAFIRARASAGDKRLGTDFLAAIQPFVWRRNLDFGQLKRIADISNRIRGHYADGQQFGPGFDLKRGRGGIREVEFHAQVLQLIHGGRNPELRAPATIDALRALANAGHIESQDAENLVSHYTTLRTIEHRLQMVDDQQTHRLPPQQTALENVAKLYGLKDDNALLELLQPVTAAVGVAFDRLIGASSDQEQQRWPEANEPLEEQCKAAGFSDCSTVARRIAEWRSGCLRVLRNPSARDALEEVLPALMAAIGLSADPDAVLSRFDALINGLPSAINFFNLLNARSSLLSTLIAILSHAPTLAADLSIRADLIEGLIDASVFAEIPTPEAITGLMRRGQRTYEQQLDHVRHIVGEHRFALGVQLVEGAADPLQIARGYSDLADAALVSITDATIEEFERAHGKVPGGELLILGLGRFGGQLLTHASDLDLILLFTGRFQTESDGARSLGATTYFNRLGQRVIAALSVPTAAGRLYEVDVRLRPQGAQGPLVASLDAFERYQHEDAWTWEHMALTRARPVYGSKQAQVAVQNVIENVLHKPRNPSTVSADVSKMRDDMAAHKPPNGPFDMKLGEGGLVDCEFAIHATQLRYAIGFEPQLDAAVQKLIDAGLAPSSALSALALLSRMLIVFRLMAPNGTPQDDETYARIAHICGYDLASGGWSALLNEYAVARCCISEWWAGIRNFRDDN